MKLTEQFWVNLVAGCVVAACVIGILIISIREKRRTGAYPIEMHSRPGDWGWFSLGFVFWFIVSIELGESLRRSFPLSVLVPGLDLSLFLAFAAFAAFALGWAFRSQWNRRTGLWISWSLLFPALTGALVLRDVMCYWSIAWIWIPAGLIAVFLTPHFARLAYLGLYASGAGAAE